MEFTDSDGVHISDFNNEWNKRALELAGEETEKYWQRIDNISRQHPPQIEDISGMEFKDFYRSRLKPLENEVGLKRAAKEVSVRIRKPFYYVQFRIYSILDSI